MAVRFRQLVLLVSIVITSTSEVLMYTIVQADLDIWEIYYDYSNTNVCRYVAKFYFKNEAQIACDALNQENSDGEVK